MRKIGGFSVALLLALAATPALADVKAGVDAWAKGDFEKAVKEWRPAAIKGDADAQFNMGQAYKMGRGVPVDMVQAQQWYAKAAEQSHPQAEDNLGLVMFQNGDRAKAMPYIRKSADRGDPRAQYILGTALFNGDIDGKDWVRAYALMTRSSAAGLPAASKALAQMDQFIPVAQRQQGLAMARDMEVAMNKPQMASASPAPASQRPTPAPIASTDLPPSSAPGATYDTRPMDMPPPPKPAPVAAAKPKPVLPAPKPDLVRSTSASGWRIQLGAFGDQARAKALWNALEGRVPALASLSPSFVKTGAVTRVQGGNLASKAAAEKVCVQVRAAGNSCLIVAP